MAPSETLKRFINDPINPESLYQPAKASDSWLPPIITGLSRRNQSPKARSTLSTSSSSDQSSSPSSSPDPSVLSRRESGSSNTSSSPTDRVESLVGNVATMSMEDGELPCILREVMGCLATFHITDRVNWYSHSISHYKGASPPNHALCIFCNTAFNSDDSATCWSEYMNHIADHFENGCTIDRSRPDFSVIKDMWRKHCIPDDVYWHCMRYTERPPNGSLIPHDHIPNEIMEKENAAYEKANRIAVRESRQEAREMRDRRHRSKASAVAAKARSKPR